MRPRFVLILALVSILATACNSGAPSEAAIATAIAQTEAAKATEIPPTEPLTNTPSPTSTPIPPTPTNTSTPKPTSTRRPTNTPTQTIEPRLATQTAQALSREATRAYNQRIDDIKAQCPPIDWQELSEVQYARDHEGECVYIRGRVNSVDLDEGILGTWIGYYSADIAVGTDLLNNTVGRITENMWISVYGRVCTDCWVSINRLDGSKTPLPGIQALLIEGPYGIIWVQE